MICYEIRLSKQAEIDLRGIFEYISFILLSPNSANNKLQNLENGIRSLNIMPKRFVKYEKEPWYSHGMRKMLVENYIVFYLVDDVSKLVTVVRVMYSARDVDGVLHVTEME